MIDNSKEYIICSAIWFDDGDETHSHLPYNLKSGYVIYGRNHHHCYATAASLFKKFGFDQDNKEDFEVYVNGVSRIEKISGFMTDRGNFVNRKEGARLAFEAGQIDELKTKLYSEDIFTKSDYKKDD